MSDKNAAKKLLKYAIEAGSESTLGGISSDSDRKWLDDAVKNITSAHTNSVERLKECLQVLQAFEVTESISADDVEETLEEIGSLCEDIDLACDFQKIGGFKVLVKLLDHSDVKIQLASTDVIAVISQNNHYCQDILLKSFGILSKLLQKTICNTDFEENLAIKSMYAISCLIRQNNTGIQQFINLDGFSYLLKGIRSNVNKLKLKSVFLLCNLCKENHEMLALINTEEYVTSLIQLLYENNNFDIVEFAVDTLITLTCHHVDFRNKCLYHSDDFKNAIQILHSNPSLKNDLPELVQSALQLAKILHLQIG